MYNNTSVKLLVTALDDLHTIKFRQGWFTLIKYEHQVGELGNQKPREELIEFVKRVREEGAAGEYQGLKKPETWLSGLDLKIENKFKKEAEAVGSKSLALGESPDGETTPAKDDIVTAQKPKSQSKVALKRQRAAAAANRSAASGGSIKPGVGLVSFKKKLNLRLGGNAVDKEEAKQASSVNDSMVRSRPAEVDDQVELRRP